MALAVAQFAKTSATIASEVLSCTRDICYCATSVAECFSSEKYSATLLTPLSQWQNLFSSEKYSAILLLYTRTEAVPPGAIAIR